MWLRENLSIASVSEAISGFEPCLQRIQSSAINREACSGQSSCQSKYLILIPPFTAKIFSNFKSAWHHVCRHDKRPGPDGTSHARFRGLIQASIPRLYPRPSCRTAPPVDKQLVHRPPDASFVGGKPEIKTVRHATF